ncbi:hypothetical protein EDM57_04255 [Brevibacillus gelatini]|uniref:Uncharacterized protein n=1 Tax=Brevibacillus gelatini TaxID=1655277 RepID=A0A3M8B7D6_9BACL|nr:hypothetical protein [Brevibacillus gelatini]RNB59361.1 hypothetical protein EDM57_04255 [Brevibacillus gelatini]
MFIKVPAFLMDDLNFENGDWEKIQAFNGQFIIIKTKTGRAKANKRDSFKFPHYFNLYQNKDIHSIIGRLL